MWVLELVHVLKLQLMLELHVLHGLQRQRLLGRGFGPGPELELELSLCAAHAAVVGTVAARTKAEAVARAPGACVWDGAGPPWHSALQCPPSAPHVVNK